MIIAALLAAPSWWEGLSDRLSKTMEAYNITGSDVALYGAVGFLLVWMGAIAATSIRGARGSHRGV